MEESINYIITTLKIPSIVVKKGKRKGQNLRSIKMGGTSLLIIDLVLLNSLPIICKEKRPTLGIFVLSLIIKKYK